MKASSPRSCRRTKVVVAILVAVIMILAAVAAGRWWKEQARGARQLAYQSALRECSRDLKPGLTRKSVEAYFHTSGIGFEKICCLGRHYQADLVKIGEEDTPWYCGPEYLDLVFEFAAAEPAASFSADYLGRDSDVLQTIEIQKRWFDCI